MNRCSFLAAASVGCLDETDHLTELRSKIESRGVIVRNGTERRPHPGRLRV